MTANSSDPANAGRIEMKLRDGPEFLIVVQQIRVPIGMTAPWHAFAAWAGSTVH